MFWDGFIALAAVGLGIAGWNVGLINSWRAPIALIAATIITQQFYIDFATWIVQQLLVQPDFATFMAYLMMWLVSEIVIEIALNLFLTWGIKDAPRIYDRIGGVVLALFKWFLICLFPLMAMQAHNKVPAPPTKEEGLINPFAIGFKDSSIVRGFSKLGKDMLPGLGAMVVSNKEPSFKPNFDRPEMMEGK